MDVMHYLSKWSIPFKAEHRNKISNQQQQTHRRKVSFRRIGYIAGWNKMQFVFIVSAMTLFTQKGCLPWSQPGCREQASYPRPQHLLTGLHSSPPCLLLVSRGRAEGRAKVVPWHLIFFLWAGGDRLCPTLSL